MTLTRTTALRLARKKDKSASLRFNGQAPGPEERVKIREEIAAWKLREPVKPPELVEYNRQVAAWRKEGDQIRGQLFAQRWTMLVNSGSIAGLGMIRRQYAGDTLEEILRQMGVEIPSEEDV